jgi:uncharacterized protein (TIGR02266 family)
MSEARKDKRSLLSLKIRYKSATLEDFIEHYSGDISRGGVFIKSKKPLAVGTLLKFEFLLGDQSPLIHGVGRVVWRREPSESGPGDPPGMGIKFIKMDPQCRNVVQQIVEERRGEQGAFERGEHSAATSVMPAASLKQTSTHPDQTSVRHVSEFLASAMAEGGADANTTREAELGAERAREVSRSLAEKREAVARGALRAGGASMKPGRSAPRVSPGTASSAFGARAGGGGLDAQQTFPNGFGQSFDAEATIVNQAIDPGLLDELRNALSKTRQAGMAQTVPPRATPVVPNTPELVTAALETLRPAPAPPMPAITARGSALTEPVGPPDEPDEDLLAEDDTGPIALVSLSPTAIPGAADSNETLGANPLSELHDGPSSPDADDDTPPVRRRKTGRALSVGLVALLLGGAGFAAWQTGLLGNGSQSATAADTEQAASKTAVADAARAKDPVADREPQSAVEPDAAVASASPAKAADSLGEEPAGAALPYVIEIVTWPAGARVTANGSASIRTPGELRFDSKPDALSLLIRKSGYRTARVSVDLGAFETEADRHVLKVEERLRARRTAAADAADAAAEPDEDALEELASAAEKTAAQVGVTHAPIPKPEGSAVEDKAPTPTAPKTAASAAGAKLEPAKVEPAKVEPTKPAPTDVAPQPKAEKPPVTAPAQEPAAEAKPAPASGTAPAAP